MAAPAISQPPALDYDESGVDLSLIRNMLALTPAERLQLLQESVNSILRIRALNAPGQ
jgi:hypothetical protein